MRTPYRQQGPVPYASSAAPSTNPANAVAVHAALLGSKTVEMTETTSLITHGLRAFRLAQVSHSGRELCCVYCVAIVLPNRCAVISLTHSNPTVCLTHVAMTEAMVSASLSRPDASMIIPDPRAITEPSATTGTFVCVCQ